MELEIKRPSTKSCEDVRGFNTMIRLYWSDAFQSVYLSEPTTAFPNLLIPLLFSQSFHHSKYPSMDIDFVWSWNICFKLLFSPWIQWFRRVVCGSEFFFFLFSQVIIFCICNISDVSLNCSWQSTAPRSGLSHAHTDIQATKWTTHSLEMSGCGLLMGNQCLSHELLNSNGRMGLWLTVHILL